jgi:hypothetical protein
MKTHNFYPVLISTLLLTSFSAEMLLSCVHTGAKGQVYLVAGNQMPSPGQSPLKPKGIKTTLYIYGLTNINEVNREGNSGFYHDIFTVLVKQVETDENGYFKVELRPGWYSLFVKKGVLFYSSQFDEKNNIHPIEVKRGKTTEVVFKANYDAVY